MLRVISLLILTASPALAQLAEGGARALGIGRAATALRGEVWGHYNAASWATLPGRAGSAFVTQMHGLSQLRLVAAAYAEPTRWGTFAATARTYGFEDYRETQIGLGYGYAIPLGRTRRLYAGLHARYYSLALGGDFGSGGAIAFSGGVLVNVLRGVEVGLAAHNVNAPGLAGGDRDLAPLALAPALTVGVAYAPLDKATVLVDVRQAVDQGTSVRVGVEVVPVEVLALRVGGASGPARFSAGLGLRLRGLRADLAAEVHETLGLTPAFSAGFAF